MFFPAAETTTPPQPSSPPAPGLRHLGRPHRRRHGCIITPVAGHRSAHRTCRQSEDAKLTVPRGDLAPHRRGGGSDADRVDSLETHPYLEAKGVRSHGLRQDEEGRLLVPVRDADGTVWSIQKIGRDGKHFQENSRVESRHFVIGDVNKPGPLLIAEGYATAATVHELTGQPAIVAFQAGNLLRVAQTYRARFPERPIYIAGDDDRHNEGEIGLDGRPKRNLGREKAEEAVAAIGGQAIFPVFAPGDKGTDWNDLAQSQGKERTLILLRAAFRSAERRQLVQDLTAARDEGHGVSGHPRAAPNRQLGRARTGLAR